MHRRYLQQAVELAIENVRCNGGPYGALIVKQGEIIAACANGVTRDLDPTAHAEVLAIRHACRNLQDYQLTGCVLYTSCEPCPMCLGAIYWARLESVYYACSRDDAAAAGFDDRFIYEQIALLPGRRSIPMHYLELADAGLPFNVWQQNVAKKLY